MHIGCVYFVIATVAWTNHVITVPAPLGLHHNVSMSRLTHPGSMVIKKGTPCGMARRFMFLSTCPQKNLTLTSQFVLTAKFEKSTWILFKLNNEENIKMLYHSVRNEHVVGFWWKTTGRCIFGSLLKIQTTHWTMGVVEKRNICHWMCLINKLRSLSQATKDIKILQINVIRTKWNNYNHGAVTPDTHVLWYILKNLSCVPLLFFQNITT